MITQTNFTTGTYNLEPRGRERLKIKPLLVLILRMIRVRLRTKKDKNHHLSPAAAKNSTTILLTNSGLLAVKK